MEKKASRWSVALLAVIIIGLGVSVVQTMSAQAKARQRDNLQLVVDTLKRAVADSSAALAACRDSLNVLRPVMDLPHQRTETREVFADGTLLLDGIYDGLRVQPVFGQEEVWIGALTSGSNLRVIGVPNMNRGNLYLLSNYRVFVHATTSLERGYRQVIKEITIYVLSKEPCPAS